MSPLPRAIVDSHHHRWRLGEGRYPWLEQRYDPASFILGDYAALCRDFDAADFRSACDGMPVVASVHVEAERRRDDALAETRWLHEQADPPDAVVAYADFGAPDVDEQLAAHAAFPRVRGIRCKPRTAPGPDRSVAGQPGTLQDPRWLAGLARLEAHGLSWDLRVPFWHLEEAAAVLRDLPRVAVVLEHAGLPWDRSDAGLAVWRRGMQALADCPNDVHVKLSEFGLRDVPWRFDDNAIIVRETVAIFGWQRCLFGSNFPVASLRIGYRELVQALADALDHLSDEAQQAVWHDNALRFYRIERP